MERRKRKPTASILGVCACLGVTRLAVVGSSREDAAEVAGDVLAAGGGEPRKVPDSVGGMGTTRGWALPAVAKPLEVTREEFWPLVTP
jgi:hypothetical protein